MGDLVAAVVGATLGVVFTKTAFSITLNGRTYKKEKDKFNVKVEGR